MITPKDVLAWIDMKPKRYYKNGVIYGAIGVLKGVDGILYVSCMVESVDSRFTKDMIKDIISLYQEHNICLITDVKSKQGLIARVLKRYDFDIKYEGGIMYSYGKKQWQ